MSKVKQLKPKDKIINDLLDQLLDEYDGTNTEMITGKDGLMLAIKKRLIERAMDKEMDHHLGYEKYSKDGINSGNSRNGDYPKTVLTEQGNIDIEVPRDRNGVFQPRIVAKGQRRWTGFDKKIISMYSRGMTTRDIQGHIKEMYGVDVDPTLISAVTDGVMDDVHEWQNRLLDAVYPIMYLDALRVKIRDEGHVCNKAAHLIIGINMSGKKELLGIWLEQNEGSKFWLKVITDLKNRGVQDVFIACVDGLSGFPEAVHAVYPNTEVQRCIVHMVRSSLRYVSRKYRKSVADDLRQIYTATSETTASTALTSFTKKWERQYPTIGLLWKNNWNSISPFFAYPPDIRKAIYTTNAIESLNMSVRKVIKNRASFPNDDAALKMLYLSIKRASEKWTRPIRDWGSALNQFAILFGPRVPIYNGTTIDVQTISNVK
ncbi:MAG: IS256 family transposase [Spirochaetes bacterium]|nr:IS256 family transposase [Spirochaetota bacterium]